MYFNYSKQLIIFKGLKRIFKKQKKYIWTGKNVENMIEEV